MAGVTCRDGLKSEEVAERCGVETLDVLLRRIKLRWFGHVQCISLLNSHQSHICLHSHRPALSAIQQYRSNTGIVDSGSILQWQI